MMKFLLILVFLPLTYVSGQGNPAVQQYDTIFTKPEVFASFPGGEDGWKKYLKKNMKYPRKAWWDEVESDVQVKVIIEDDGTVSGAQHLNISNYGFEKEAVRLVRKSGRWKPAIDKGRPVKSEGVINISFRLK